MEKRESSTPPSWWFSQIVTLARERQSRLLHGFGILRSLFLEHEIEYFLTGGTLLGALRHGSFIPHDDDLDFGVWTEDLEKIKAVLPPLFEWRDNCMWEGRTFVSLAMSPGTREESVEFVQKEHCRKDEVIGKYYEHPEELLPFRTVSFCGMDVPIPQGAEAYLERLYPNWRTECVVFAHYDNFSINNVWRVSLDEYNKHVKLVQDSKNENNSAS